MSKVKIKKKKAFLKKSSFHIPPRAVQNKNEYFKFDERASSRRSGSSFHNYLKSQNQYG